MRPDTGHDDDALLAACRAGDERAGRRFVERHQRDLLRVAYLLAGDGERASRTATGALHDLFRHPPDEEADVRHLSLLALAGRYLERPGRSTWLERDAEASYVVEDERDRVRAALDRLEPPERVALVLSRFAGLAEQDILPALNVSRYELHTMIERAAARVALAAGRASDGPVADLLARLLVEAPAGDLWSELAGPLRNVWKARQRRRRVLAAVALSPFLIALAAGLLWLAGTRLAGGHGDERPAAASATRSPDSISTVEPRAQFAAATPSRVPREVVSVPDLQLIRAIEHGGSGQSSLLAYDPTANETRPLLDAGSWVKVSPDGRWLVSRRNLVDPPGVTLLTGAPVDGGAAAWELQLPSVRSVAVGPDVVYVLNLPVPGAERFQVQTVELATGMMTGGWEVEGLDSELGTVWGARVFVPAGGERVYVLTEHFDIDSQVWSLVVTVYRPGDGVLIDSFVHETLPIDGRVMRAFSVGGALPMPAENALYSVVPDVNWRHLMVQVLDLERGTLSTLPVPLSARSTQVSDSRGDVEVHLVPSNTGELLYIIQSRFRQVAVVDLLDRSLIGIFPIIAGDHVQSGFETNLHRVSYLETLLSPDGTRLYLASSWEKNQAVFGYPASAPVWVIDTTSWEVIDRWTVDGMMRSMTMSGDGTRLYVRSVRADGDTFLTFLTVFDTASGDALHVWQDIPAPEWSDLQRLSAIQHLYHAQYGVRPAVDGVIPSDNRDVAVLPAVRIEADGAVAGADVVVTARVVHPLTGEPATDEDTLRFDPEATLAIELSNGGWRVIFVPLSVEPGLYQGWTRLDLAGAWDARVTFINSDGTTWKVEQPSAIRVSKGLLATDGNDYGFEIRPANPVTRRTITLRVWMVNAETGRRLPGEVEIADGVPGNVRLVLTHPEGEQVEVPLDPLDHASFLGWARFSLPGEWAAEVSFVREGGQRITVDAGVVEIRDLTEPYRSAASISGGARMGNPQSK